MYPIQLDSVFFPHNRYVSLRIISAILALLGALALAVACVCGLVLLFRLLAAGKSDHPNDQLALAMASGTALTVAGPALAASLVFFAHAALTHLSIHVEENTRATAQLLHALCGRLPGPRHRNASRKSTNPTRAERRRAPPRRTPPTTQAGPDDRRFREHEFGLIGTDREKRSLLV